MHTYCDEDAQRWVKSHSFAKLQAVAWQLSLKTENFGWQLDTKSCLIEVSRLEHTLERVTLGFARLRNWGVVCNKLYVGVPGTLSFALYAGCYQWNIGSTDRSDLAECSERGKISNLIILNVFFNQGHGHQDQEVQDEGPTTVFAHRKKVWAWMSVIGKNH